MTQPLKNIRTEITRFLKRRECVGALLLAVCFCRWEVPLLRPYDNPLYIVGSQGLGDAMQSSALPAPGLAIPWYHKTWVGIVETDSWAKSLENGTLSKSTEFPVNATHAGPSSFRRPGNDLMHETGFTAAVYLKKIADLKARYPAKRDVLMYFGGLRKDLNGEGLNFNAWSLEQLRQLRELGCQPFIGLETIDPTAVSALMNRLHSTGFGRRQAIYIRLLSEPSGEWYGSEEGTGAGRRHTAAAFQAYQQRFALGARQLRHWRERFGMNLKIVFAGTNREDFEHYAPPLEMFDDIGFDLYVTPANKERILGVMEDVLRRFAQKPIVIPELGIATEGPKSGLFQRIAVQASPRWAEETLGEVLIRLGRQSDRVKQITIFSVDVAGRLDHRRWSWAWTPVMFEMMREWRESPGTWRLEGFHPYDPLTYPVGQDILYVNKSTIRVYYRKLSTTPEPNGTRFLETLQRNENGVWTSRQQAVQR